MSEKNLRAVVVLHEGVPGHRNQSLGIAEELKRECQAATKEFSVPNFRGMERWRKVKSKLTNLAFLPQEELKAWLVKAEGESIQKEIERWLAAHQWRPEQLLVISAGSRVAPYTYAIAKLLGARSATLMTPKYLGTEPFDFSIIPAHDVAEEKANQLVTLGAPNRIQKEEIEQAATDILEKYPRRLSKAWVILIGGENSTFRLPPDWAKRTLRPIVEKAEKEGADLYLATSRRTRRETEKAIVELLEGHQAVRLIWLASEKPENPVPGLLGIAERVYCTEDSISMVSEALTAGKAVVLLQTEYVGGPKEILKKWGLKTGLLEKRSEWKPDKFRRLYDAFRQKGWLYDPGQEPNEMPDFEFNEAHRAAKWILSRW